METRNIIDLLQAGELPEIKTSVSIDKASIVNLFLYGAIIFIITFLTIKIIIK